MAAVREFQADGRDAASTRLARIIELARALKHGESHRGGQGRSILRPRSRPELQAGATTTARTERETIRKISCQPLPNTSLDSAELQGRIERFQKVHADIVAEVRKVIVGQEEVIEQVLIALFVGGHCLITGLPGTAKTLLVRTIAEALGLEFRRIQFTPDLMPSDITGTESSRKIRPPAIAPGRSCPVRFSPTCSWPTKSTARRPRRSRRCSKRCRSARARCAAALHNPRRSSSWPRKTPSNSKALSAARSPARPLHL